MVVISTIFIGVVHHCWSWSFFVVLKLHLWKKLSVYFSINIQIFTIFFQTLCRGHFNKVLARWLFLLQKLIRLPFWLTRLNVWRRHEIWITNLLKIWDYSMLTLHLFLHKLVELIDRNIFEWSILALSHKPVENFFKSILFPLLIGQVKCIAWLLVKSSQCICRIYETILQRIKMNFTRRVTNQLIWI